MPPGRHFFEVAKRLHGLGIKVPEIIKYSDCAVTTRYIDGITLKEAFLKSDAQRISQLLDQYTSVLAKIFDDNIYFADFHFKNFIVEGHTLIACDLDDYRTGMLAKWKIKRLLRQLHQKQLPTVVEKLYKFVDRRGDKKSQAMIKKLITTRSACILIKAKLAHEELSELVSV
jgi:predicted unusual protein kinase regulating ubiquinone biosynthesis (AarF/ABC1/UbiB family)